MHAWLLAYYYYSGWDGTLWLPTNKQQAAGKEGSILLALHLISGESPGLQADEKTEFSSSPRPALLASRLPSIRATRLDGTGQKGEKIEEKKWLDLGNSRQGGF